MCKYYWNEAKLFKFLRLYRVHDCLWNPYSLDYKNCDTKSKAFSKILYEMETVGLTVNECLSQIKNLRKTYKAEHQRLENIELLGGRGHSNILWYPLMNSMLSKVLNDEKKLIEETDSNSEFLKLQGDDRCSYCISDRNYKVAVDNFLASKKERKRLKIENKFKIRSRENVEAILKGKNLSLKGLSKVSSSRNFCQNNNLKNFESLLGKKEKFDENSLRIKIEKSNDSKKICWREPVEESFIIFPCRSSNNDMRKKDKLSNNDVEKVKSMNRNFRMIAGSDFGICDDNLQISRFDIFDKNLNDRLRNDKETVIKINEEICIEKNFNEDVIKISSDLINERDNNDNENFIDSKIRNDEKYQQGLMRINDNYNEGYKINYINDKESSVYKIIEDCSKIEEINEKYLNIDNNETKTNFFGKELSIIGDSNIGNLIRCMRGNENNVKILKNILLNETFDDNIENDKFLEKFVNKIIDIVKISLDEIGLIEMNERTTWKMELKKIVADIMKKNLKRNNDEKNYSLKLKLKTTILSDDIKTNQRIEKKIVENNNLYNDDLKNESNESSLIESEIKNLVRMNSRRKKKIKGSIFFNKNNLSNDLKKFLNGKKFSRNFMKYMNIFLSIGLSKLNEDKLLPFEIINDNKLENFLNKSQEILCEDTKKSERIFLFKDSKLNENLKIRNNKDKINRSRKDSFSQTNANDCKDFDINNLNNRDKSVEKFQNNLNELKKFEDKEKEKEKSNKFAESKSCQTESSQKFLNHLIKSDEEKIKKIYSSNLEYTNDDSLNKKLLDIIKKIRNNIKFINDINLINSKDIYLEEIINDKEKEGEIQKGENSEKNNFHIEKMNESYDKKDKEFGATDRNYDFDKNYICCKESTEVEIEKFVDTVASVMRRLSRSIKIDTI